MAVHFSRPPGVVLLRNLRHLLFLYPVSSQARSQRWHCAVPLPGELNDKHTDFMQRDEPDRRYLVATLKRM